MNEIKCPKCGTVFAVDETGYADLVKQVRDQEFAREVSERQQMMAREKDQAVELARQEVQGRLQQETAARDARIAELEARVAAAGNEQKLAREQAAAEARAAAQSEASAQREQAQQRTAELVREVDRLKAELARQQDAAELAGAQTRQQRAISESARDAEISALKAQLDAAASQQAMALDKAAAEASERAAQEAARSREEAERQRAELRERLQKELDGARAEAEDLRARLRERESAAKLEQARALADVERQRDRALAELAQERAVAAAQREQEQAAHALELEQAKKSSEALIRYKDEEIERLRDMKARLSTKMVGETLEQHCETEFNRLRMTAFPQAYFEKDNDASGGTKGDYIFRETDEAGNEVISIMFEMKNENDATASKHKNEDFFKKLDHDRAAKGCEYAVLVSLLEPESELYNAGIVDVSYRYPKMYVIRPQFFIPMITLLRKRRDERAGLQAGARAHAPAERRRDQLRGQA